MYFVIINTPQIDWREKFFLGEIKKEIECEYRLKHQIHLLINQHNDMTVSINELIKILKWRESQPYWLDKVLPGNPFKYMIMTFFEHIKMDFMTQDHPKK